MTNKEVQLLILRHLESGHTKADMNLLTIIPAEQRHNVFVDALIAIEKQGFLCPNYNTSDEPELWNAFVSNTGKAFIRENTPEPLVQTIQRTAGRWIEVFVTALITGIVGILLTLYITGKLG